MNISLETYDAKAALLFNRNLMHTMDAAFVKRLSQALKDAGINGIQFTLTHDSFAFVDTYFAKSFIEFAYLIVHKQDYINSLKDNTNFNSLLPIIQKHAIKFKIGEYLLGCIRLRCYRIATLTYKENS